MSDIDQLEQQESLDSALREYAVTNMPTCASN
jgi:hypothetical protein